MKDRVIEHVRKLLEENRIQGFLGLKEEDGHIKPYLFEETSELREMDLGDYRESGDARYPLNGVLIHLTRSYPDATFGVLVRGCDERGLIELFKWNQLSHEKVILVGIPCSGERARACACGKPYPDSSVIEERSDGISEDERVSEIESLSLKERFRFWEQHFERCIKCYGCRNICPMCFCTDCSLEEEELVGKKGVLPPEAPIFHLVRAIHMIGRCVDCGLCEEACPADIPLRTLYKKVAEIVKTETGYQVGESLTVKCPYNVLSSE